MLHFCLATAEDKVCHHNIDACGSTIENLVGLVENHYYEY